MKTVEKIVEVLIKHNILVNLFVAIMMVLTFIGIAHMEFIDELDEIEQFRLLVCVFFVWITAYDKIVKKYWEHNKCSFLSHKLHPP